MRANSARRRCARCSASGEWPARNPDRNISDLKAQLAACMRGAEVLAATARDYGAEVVAAYMGHVLANAEASVRRLLDRLDDGEFDYEMDNGAHIRVRITYRQGRTLGDVRLHRHERPAARQFQRALFDRPRGLAVRRAHVDRRRDPDERWLPAADRADRAPRIDAQSKLSGGRRGRECRDQPGRHRRLVGGDRRLAPSQGTMNNFTFGNERHQYYETIAGGSGAGPDHDGTSAVQTHMTNSRLTDPEILETRLPVRLDQFAIRRSSGGQGAHRGGDGVVRALTFLEPMRANILANRRRDRPARDRGRMRRSSRPQLGRTPRRSVEMMSATAYADVKPGDRFVIETPGGGGFGRKAG